MHQVFISYSSKDASVANAVCHKLEAAGIRCWIAPRDIRPGDLWAESISQAIKAAKVFVLIFSDHSNQSNQVSKELTLAVNSHLMIFPFKITETLPKGAFEYYLSDTHWLDALTQPLEESIDHMKDVVALYLKTGAKDGYSPESRRQGHGASFFRSNRFAIMAILLAVIVVGSGFIFFRGSSRTVDLSAVAAKVDVNTEQEANMPLNKAKEIVENVLTRRPLTAFGFDDSEGAKVVALLNENEMEGEPGGSLMAWFPELRMVVIKREAGVWSKSTDLRINSSYFYKRIIEDMSADEINLEDDFILFEFDEDCSVVHASGKDYLYFHASRTVGGNATADVLNDFVCVDMGDGRPYILRYLEDHDIDYNDNGEMFKYDPYPEGIGDYLLHKLEIDKSIKKIEQ